MPRYYFDIRKSDHLTADEEGIKFKTMGEVQEEAAESLADMARDALRTPETTGPKHQMAIEVRDNKGPVLKAHFTFELERHR
jgi:hypothetical protein